ncbi:hypothetical protein ACFXPS_33765 [Nocardia sp. NPDC059091]|uniref:hypothetical protein n=1 Tax=unclassified Nocardia TaxID=2637762 RepID=UPI00367E14C2
MKRNSLPRRAAPRTHSRSIGASGASPRSAHTTASVGSTRYRAGACGLPQLPSPFWVRANAFSPGRASVAGSTRGVCHSRPTTPAVA